jgi:hypothetical protein
MNKLIQVPSLPNIYLFALKTPLASAHQVLFPYSLRWTIEAAIAQACADLGQQRFEVVVTSVETNGPFDFMDPGDCDSCDVRHAFQEIDGEYSPDRIGKFCDLMRLLASPGPTQAVLVSSHNGINKPGFLIAGFLMWCQKMSARNAVDLFNSVHSPICAQPAINCLNQFRPGRDPAMTGKPGPSNETLPPVDRNCVALIKQEAIHMLHSFGGQLLHPTSDADQIARIKAHLLSLSGAKLRNVQGDLFPTVSVWSRDQLELLTMHQFRMTYTPRGTTVYLVILDHNFLYLCIPSGNNTWNETPDPHQQFYGFPATVTCELPVICIGVLTEIAARPVVILTDVMKKGSIELSRCGLEDRLSHLWFDVVDKINDCGLQFRFRAVGLVTTNMIDLEATLRARLGFQSDGLMLLADSFPAGMSLFIPIRPTIKLRVHLNTKKLAILFARADDGTGLFPITIWCLENEADRLMEGKTVRFEVSAVGGEVKFRPVLFSNTDTHDFACDVKPIIEFIRQGYQTKVEVAECEKMVCEQFT